MIDRARTCVAGRNALLMAAVVLAGPAAAATDEQVRALEARVAELERLVRELAGGPDAPAPSAEAGVSPAVRTAIDEAITARTGAGPGSSYRVGGYVKADAMFSHYSGGEVPSGGGLSQFYIPALIPVGGASSGPNADFQARETRFFFRSDHVLADGDEVGTFIELDFFLSPGGDERVSNSYNPRLRNAFMTYNNWLFGQTWSTFQNVRALPDTIDFIGPAEGTVFVREAQVRYTHGPWQFALENPETTLTPNGGGPRIITDDGIVPDIVVRYEHKDAWGELVLAAIGRELHYETATFEETELAFGVSASGTLNFGENDLRWMLTAGSGIGRYLGVNTIDDAVLTPTGELEPVEQIGGFVAYRHHWSPQLRSSFVYSTLLNDNDTSLSGTAVTKDVYSLHANLIWRLASSVEFGAELIYAQRELENGLDGDMTRLMFSAKYAF